MIPKQIPRQRDFSGGEVDSHLFRRDDSALVRAGARQMSNKRILSSGGLDQRPGRRVQFVQEGRTELLRMSDDIEYSLSFGEGTLFVLHGSSPVLSETGYSWTVDTVDQITFASFDDDVVICFPGMQPRVLSYADGAWTSAAFAPQTTDAGRKLTPFYRFAAPGITMALSALTGSVTVTFSDDVLTEDHVGTRMRYYDKQITITAYTSPTEGTATVNEVLRQVFSTDFTDDVTDQFSIGDVIENSTTGAKRYVAEVGTPGSDDLTLIRLNAISSSVGNVYVGPSGEAEIQAFNAAPTTGPAITVWDEEVFNSFRGWPHSVFVDQRRLGFCDFPSLPRAIAWSAIDDMTDLDVGADPADAMLELVPGSARVQHVVPGDDEFVFTDRGVFYIPISESNPLRPGSVAFRPITREAASDVHPVSFNEVVLYFNEGENKLVAIVPTGQTTKPYLTRSVSDFHSHLLVSPRAIAVSSGEGQFPESYIYVLNGDGSIAIGRFEAGREWVGFLPWTPANNGTFEWVSTLGGDVLVTTKYTLGEVERWLVEMVDIDAYLDAQSSENGSIIAWTFDSGVATFDSDIYRFDMGGAPHWPLAGEEVAVMDGMRYVGLRTIDADGELVPESDDDDFTSDDLVVGLPWTEVLEPFIPHAQSGESRKQTMRRRKLGKMAWTTRGRTGYVFADRRVPPYRQGEDEGAVAAEREETKMFRKLGRSFDPRVEHIKDIPGPLRIIEFAADVTV